MSSKMKKLKDELYDVEASFELDLAPMLALMVTLIPIMLLSTVFVQITLIETPLPQVVQKAIKDDLNNKNKKVSLSLNMQNKTGFKLYVQQAGRTIQTIRLPKVNNQWDLSGLYQATYKLKLKNPLVFGVDLKPGAEVSYDDIVKVMDEMRSIKKEDKKVIITDKDTQQKVETEVMFPNITFGNVVEG